MVVLLGKVIKAPGLGIWERVEFDSKGLFLKGTADNVRYSRARCLPSPNPPYCLLPLPPPRPNPDAPFHSLCSFEDELPRNTHYHTSNMPMPGYESSWSITNQSCRNRKLSVPVRDSQYIKRRRYHHISPPSGGGDGGGGKGTLQNERTRATATSSERGGVLISCMAVAVGLETIASLQRRDGARRVFTDQADIARLNREAP